MHFPWCVAKCPYCDFNSHPLKPDTDFAAYKQALLSDWHQQQEKFDLDTQFTTIFIGGGTPSLFPAKYMAAVLNALPVHEEAEVTMEANPGTTEYTNLAEYLDAGVNRLSIGAQSFNSAALERLGRIHTTNETLRAYTHAREAGFKNINLDLMWGLPQQSVAEALEDLDQALALKPEHISWYQLTIEAKTEFARRPPILPVEDRLADIESLGLSKLAQAGYTRYEVSAFSQPNFCCRHNMNYWSFGDYIGIGAGAHGKLSLYRDGNLKIMRTQKATQPRLYLADPTETQVQEVGEDQVVLEFMLNALRCVEGVDKTVFERSTGRSWQSIEPQWRQLVDQGLVRADRCATTPLGLRYLDSVVASFID